MTIYFVTKIYPYDGSTIASGYMTDAGKAQALAESLNEAEDAKRLADRIAYIEHDIAKCEANLVSMEGWASQDSNCRTRAEADAKATIAKLRGILAGLREPGARIERRGSVDPWHEVTTVEPHEESGS